MTQVSERPVTPATLPIVVDLDGTLIHTDSFQENVRTLIRGHGLKYMAVVPWWAVARGKSFTKHAVAERIELDASQLPYRATLLEWLRQKKQLGHPIVLATGTTQKTAETVAKHLGLFDKVLASTPTLNLVGRNKAQALAEVFPDGFLYVGDNHRVDMHVWRQAKAVGLAGRRAATIKHLLVHDTPPEEFADLPLTWRTWISMLGLRQWVSNLIVFLPLLIYGMADSWAGLPVAFAFVALGLQASAAGLLHALWRAPDDRLDPLRRMRPLAAGTLSVEWALMVIFGLSAAALALAAWTGWTTLGLVMAHQALWLGYIFRRLPLAGEAVVLTVLFLLRLVIGLAALSLSVWPEW